MLERLEEYEESQDEPLTEEERQRNLEIAERTRYAVGINNVSDRIPRYLVACVYDAENRNFLRTFLTEVLREDESRVIPTLPTPANQAEAREWLEAQYGEAAGPEVKGHIRYRDTSYILVFYEDVEGNLYTYEQEFAVDDDGEVEYPSRSRLLFEV